MLVIRNVVVQQQWAEELPPSAQVLTVQMQETTPVMWVIFDPALPWVRRWFRTYATGDTVPDPVPAQTYIGTYQTGRLAMHVFELIEEP